MDRTKVGAVLVCVGLFLALLSLLYSRNYVDELGFLGSIPFMEVRVYEGRKGPKRNPTLPSDQLLPRGPIIVPTRYLLTISAAVVLVGVIMILIGKETTGKQR